MNDYYKGLSGYNNYRYGLIDNLENLRYEDPGYSSALSQLQYETGTRPGIYNTQPNTNSIFGGLASPTWQGIGSTLQGLGGLASAYMGYKQYGLAKDAFNFNKGLANRNLATQGQLLNQEMYDRKARALAGSSLSPEEKARELEEVKNKYIDTTPIK
jgi:hypothetical protein